VWRSQHQQPTPNTRSGMTNWRTDEKGRFCRGLNITRGERLLKRDNIRHGNPQFVVHDTKSEYGYLGSIHFNERCRYWYEE
jgi:hypothetical protein